MMEILPNMAIPIIILFLLGIVLKKLDILNDEAINTVNKLVIYVSIPALTFLTVFNLKLPLLTQFWPFTLTCLIVGIVAGAIVYGMASFQNMDTKKKWAIVIPVTFGSTTFMALPIANKLYAGAAMISAIKFYDLSSYILIILLNVVLMLVLAKKNDVNSNVNDDNKYTKILVYPIFLAFILGLVANAVTLPHFPVLVNTLGYLASAAIPLLALTIGAALKFDEIKDWILAAGVSLVKLIIVPIIAVVCYIAFGITGLAMDIGLLSAIVPCGLATMAIAIDNELDYSLTAQTIFLSAIIALITMPLLTMLF